MWGTQKEEETSTSAQAVCTRVQGSLTMQQVLAFGEQVPALSRFPEKKPAVASND